MTKRKVTDLLPHGGVLIQNTADLFILEEFEKAGITWVGPYQIKATKLDPTILGAKFPFTIYVDENGLSWHGGRVVIYPASDFLKGEKSATTTDLEVEELSWSKAELSYPATDFIPTESDEVEVSDTVLLSEVRNKLNPIKNLIAMLENGLVKGSVEMHDLVFKEIEQCKINIEELTRNTPNQ